MPPDPVDTERLERREEKRVEVAEVRAINRLQAENERLREALETIRDGTAPPATTERESMDQPTLPRTTIHKLAASALHPEPTEENDGTEHEK